MCAAMKCVTVNVYSSVDKVKFLIELLCLCAVTSVLGRPRLILLFTEESLLKGLYREHGAFYYYAAGAITNIVIPTGNLRWSR